MICVLLAGHPVEFVDERVAEFPEVFGEPIHADVRCKDVDRVDQDRFLFGLELDGTRRADGVELLDDRGACGEGADLGEEHVSGLPRDRSLVGPVSPLRCDHDPVEPLGHQRESTAFGDGLASAPWAARRSASQRVPSRRSGC